MPNNNINISFDILKVQGAKKITGKDGKEYVAICIPESRIKRFQRKDGTESLFFELDVKSNRDGEDKFGKTHFVAEAASKEERMAKTRLPIIGNSREFVFGGSSGGGRSAPARPKAADHPLMQDNPPQDDDIPW